MSTPKPEPSKSSEAYSVKYSNRSGGAYADIKAVIQSERDTWHKSDKASNRNSDGQQDQSSPKK